jgi:hypothetical protein
MTDTDIVTRLRDFAAMDDWPFIAEAADEIERLREERDEARQRYCIAVSEHGESAEAQQIAKDEGWDCFKEDTDV